MYRLLLVVALLASANAAVLPNGRITGGSPANITEAPHTASLLVDWAGSGTFSQACGAVIVSRTAVITSAQCTGFPVARLRIRVGSTYHNSGGQVIQVASIKNHDQYNSASFNNDLSILRLATQIVLGSNAATITLPAQGAALTDGTTGMHFGWGRLGPGGNIPVNLHKVGLPVINQAICASAYSGFNVTANMFCVGRHGVGGVGPCQGDIGGPFSVGGVLHGINSWGKGCGEPNHPSVFTKISMYRTWLNQNL